MNGVSGTNSGRFKAVVFAVAGLILFTAFASVGCGGKMPTKTEGSGSDQICCRIALSVNPGVEFQLDKDGKVIGVVGLNEDGTALIAGLDFAGLSFENAAILVVNRLIIKRYITAQMVDEAITLRFSGQTVVADTLATMSEIIGSAVSQFNLSVDTIEKDQNTVEVVMVKTSNRTQGNTLPKTDRLRLKYEFETKTTVGNIHIYSGTGKKFPDIVDFAGMTVKTATLRCILELIDRGCIQGGNSKTVVTLELPGYDDASTAEIMDLISLIMQEAGLQMEVSQTGLGQIRIVPSGTAAAERTATYTLHGILAGLINPAADEVTPLQMQILSMVYAQDEIAFMLKPRYWAVIPNFAGLREEDAVRLCKQVGLVPVVYREARNPSSTSPDAPIGCVFMQDCNAGGLWEIGSRFLLFVNADGPEPTQQHTQQPIE